MRYSSLRQRPKHFQAFTGLRVEEFDRLIALITQDWIDDRLKRLQKKKKRKRKIGGGRKYELETIEDQLLLALVWSRLYPVYLTMEYLFGVDESTVSRTIQRIQPLLRDRFMLPERLPHKKVKTLEELKKYLPPDIDLDDILADATEQVIQRPEDGRKRRPYHSGKKRRFTAKTQIATTRKGYAIHVSGTVGGRMHDYKLFKRSWLPSIIPKGANLFIDNGFQGTQKDYPKIHSVLPFKRHRGKKKLSRSEKIFNKKQRRVRIRVENTLAHFKQFKSLSEIYRHSLHNYNQNFRFIANIVNFRMLQRLQAS